jgi:uncharacterized peroxidase-related enzyme
MSRLQAVDPTAATGKAQALLEGVRNKLGLVPNMMRTMASSPAVLDGYLGLSGALGAGQLPASLREQIALAVAQANGCGYCLAAHSLLGSKAGLTDGDVAAARRGEATDPRDRAAIRFALAVVASRGGVDDAELGRVRGAGFGDGEIAEIVAHVALNVLTNYLNRVADTEIDFPKPPALASEAA